jgi:hypothetical protein
MEWLGGVVRSDAHSDAPQWEQHGGGVVEARWLLVWRESWRGKLGMDLLLARFLGAFQRHRQGTMSSRMRSLHKPATTSRPEAREKASASSWDGNGRLKQRATPTSRSGAPGKRRQRRQPVAKRPVKVMLNGKLWVGAFWRDSWPQLGAVESRQGGYKSPAQVAVPLIAD